MTPLYDDDLPAHVADSDTSVEAAESMTLLAPKLRDLVAAELRRRGGWGATNDELEEHMDIKHQTLSPRVRELVQHGKVKDSGQRRRTRSGRFATVWVWGSP